MTAETIDIKVTVHVEQLEELTLGQMVDLEDQIVAGRNFRPILEMIQAFATIEGVEARDLKMKDAGRIIEQIMSTVRELMSADVGQEPGDKEGN